MSCSVTVERSIGGLARAGEMSRSISSWLRSFETGGGDAHVANRWRMEDAVGLEGHDLTAHGDLAEQRRGGPFAVAGVNRGEEVGCPELSNTRTVSECSASLVATTGAEPGAQRMRTAQSDWPSRCESSWPTAARHDHRTTAGIVGRWSPEDLGQSTERRSWTDVELG